MLEDHCRKILDSALDAVVVIQGVSIVYVNDAFLVQYKAHSRDEVIGRNALDFVVPEDREMITENAMKRQRGEDVTSNYSFRGLCLDGTIIDVDSNVSYIEWGGKPASLTFNRDITSREEYRKQYMERLDALHTHATTLSRAESMKEIGELTFQALSDVFGIHDGGFGVIEEEYINYVYLLSHISSDPFKQRLDSPGVTVRAYHTGETQLIPDTSLDLDYISRINRSYNEGSELAVPVFIKDKVAAVINIEIEEKNAFTINDVKLVELFSIHIASAINRINQVEKVKELGEEHNKHLVEGFQRFSSMIRHDLRTPLMTINNAVALMGEDSSETEKMLDLIKSNIRYAGDIMEDWKQKTLQGNIMKVPCIIQNLIFEAMSTGIIKENIISNVNVEENLIFDLDHISMTRVLSNLVKNAVEAMQEGGELEITAQTAENNLIIRVTDTGAGMTPQTLSNIFTPFYTTKKDGMGLGLAYCKQTVDAHGGIITVESEQDKGTTFTIKIPP